jgi:hypothetical protein
MTATPHAARRVAVLIDADNVSPRVVDEAMSAAKSHGSIILACAYRHWTDATRKGWDDGCRKHNIQRIEQAPGPNATDIALAIDAVDLLRDRGLDVICVVSGDRDFAPLAARLRESRLTAVLMADPAKVKDSNRTLWDAFVALKVGSKTSAPAAPKPAAFAPASARPASAQPPNATTPLQATNAGLIEAVLARLADETVKKGAGGWVILNEIGKGIPAALKKPSLRKALGAAKAIEIEERLSAGKANPTQWIRKRPGHS